MYRRNGKPQSCEPCRKWKIRCDHQLPVCQRCHSRDIANKCFYHPAPMSARRQDTGSVPEGAASTIVGGSEGSNRSGTGEAATVDFEQLIPISDTSSHEVSVSASKALLAPSDIQSGVRVLALLHQHWIWDKLVWQSYRRTRVPLLPPKILDGILESIRNLLSQVPATQCDQHLTGLATQICQNSSRPLPYHRLMTFEEYLSSFTGKNLRWEAIGNLIAVAGRSLIATPINDGLFLDDGPLAREALVSQIAEASNLCLSFCSPASCSNELLVSLQVNDVMLKTQQFGDSSYEAWKRLADLSATLYFTGLHQYQGSDSPGELDPAFVVQLKRGCFAAAFYVDKCIATFLGRPPLLNYRHCILTLPLDLSDDVLVADNNVLADAVQQLTADGWNRDGHVYRSGLMRVRFLLSIIRSQVLETTAAPFNDSVPPRVNQILEEARNTWETCPDTIRFDRLHPEGDDEHSNTNTFTMVSIYLDYLHSRLLLLRYLAGHASQDSGPLLDTASQVLATINKAITYRASSIDMSRDYSWISLYYGIPSATLLAQELRRTQPDHLSGSPTGLVVSKIVRSLCVFTSNLTWVTRPSQGDYAICRDAERGLSQVLDEYLDRIPSSGVDTDLGELDEAIFDWTDSQDFGPVLFG